MRAIMIFVINAMPLVAITLGLATGGCAASNWMGGPASEMNPNHFIKWSATINQHELMISVPDGGREFFESHSGPLQVKRTDQATFDATTIFTREYGLSSMGPDYGAFRVSIQTIGVPRTLPPIPDDVAQLESLIQKVSPTRLQMEQIKIGSNVWIHEAAPTALYGYLDLYTRKLDADALISVSFDLDRAHLLDKSWHQGRQRDIDSILSSISITALR